MSRDTVLAIVWLTQLGILVFVWIMVALQEGWL